MSKRSGLGQRFYVHGVDLSGDIAAINNASSPRAAIEVTAINQSAVERLYGLSDGRLEFQAFFNPAAGQAHPTLSALPTTDVLVSWLLGTTRGDPVACLLGKQLNYDGTRADDGSLLLTVQAQASAGVPLEWADLLAAKTTHASAASETGLDQGAQTTSGGVGYLQHFSLGSGTVTYNIEDSANSTNGVDGVWTNLLSFTPVAAASGPTAERVTVAGTVERWVRATTSGTFANAVFAIAFRRKTAQDLS